METRHELSAPLLEEPQDGEMVLPSALQASITQASKHHKGKHLLERAAYLICGQSIPCQAT
jgi:hypothetical protein